MKKIITIILSTILISIPCFANTVDDIKHDYDLINTQYNTIITLTNNNLLIDNQQKEIYKNYLNTLSDDLKLKTDLLSLDESKILCSDLIQLIKENSVGDVTDVTRNKCTNQYKTILNKDNKIDEVFKLIEQDYKINTNNIILDSKVKTNTNSTFEKEQAEEREKIAREKKRQELIKQHKQDVKEMNEALEKRKEDVKEFQEFKDYVEEFDKNKDK